MSQTADAVRLDPNLQAEQTHFSPLSETDSLTLEMSSAVESAIAKIKELRFVFEQEGNLIALNHLEDELLTELDLLNTTKWSVEHQKATTILNDIKGTTETCEEHCFSDGGIKL